MVFIEQPKAEGETKDCPNCGKVIVSRLKEYKDFPNKIQWQDKDETKAHYDKNGNCKGAEQIPNEIELKAPEVKDDSQSTLEAPTEYVPPVTMESLRDELKFQREILQSILHIVADLKTEGVKLQK